MKTTEGQKKQMPLPSAKQHLALCYSVIDLGTQVGVFNGNATSSRKIYLSFEIPGEKAVFSEERGPQCFGVGQEYTFSLDSKANFRKMIDSWMGAPVTELDSEKIKKLLKRPAMIQVVHAPSKDGSIIYANIANKGVSIFKRPTDQPFPKNTENEAFFFDLDNFDADTFEKIPKWLKEKVIKSPEYKAIVGGAGQASAQVTETLGDDEDAPF